MGDLSWLPQFAPLGATGLLAIAVLMIFTDRLVTRGRLNDAHDERDKWREAFETEREKGDARDDQIAKLVAAVESSLSALGDHREGK